MSSIQPGILNSSFSVVSYNGGPLNGRNGIEKMLQVAPGDKIHPHSTRHGANFDLVLEYSNDKHDKFTLTHVAFMAPDYTLVTAPLKNGMVWVTNSSESHSSFAEFNDLNEAEYFNLIKDSSSEKKDILNSQRPTFFEFRRLAADCVSAVPKGVRSTGNRVHIKFVTCFGDEVNIDMGNFFLLGFHGEAPAGFVASDVEESTANGATRAITVELGIAQPALDKGKVNELIPALDLYTYSSPSVIFISRKPVDSLTGDAKVAFDNLKSVATTFANTDLAFFSLDCNTNKDIGEKMLHFLGATPMETKAQSQASKDNAPADALVDPKGTLELSSIFFRACTPQDELSELGDVDAADIVIEDKTEDVSVGDFVLHDNLDFIIAAFDRRVSTVKFLLHRQTIADLKKALSSTLASENTDVSDIEVFVRSFLVVLETFEVTASQIVSGSEAVEDSEAFKAMTSVFHRYRSTTNTPAGATHALYPNLYIATAATFQEVVLDCPENVLVVLSSSSILESQVAAAMTAELAEHFAEFKFNKMKVVIIDATRNDLMENLFPEADMEPIKLYIKRTKADVAASKTKAKGKGKGKAAPVTEIPPIYVTPNGTEVSVESFNFVNEDIDEEDEMSYLHDARRTPSVMALINFVHQYLPQLFSPLPPKTFTTKGVSLEKAIESLDYCMKANIALVANVRSLLRIKGTTNSYLYPAINSKAAKVLSGVKTIYDRAYKLSQQIPSPVGQLAFPITDSLPKDFASRVADVGISKQKYKHCIMVTDVVDELVKMKEQTEKNLMDIQDLFRGVRITQNLIHEIIVVFQSFADVADAFVQNKANLTLCKDFVKTWHLIMKQTAIGTHTTIPETMNKSFTAIGLDITPEAVNETDVVYVTDVEMVKATTSVQAFMGKLSETVSAAVKEIDEKCLHVDFRRVHSEKQLVRALEGYKTLIVKLAKKGVKKTAEQVAKEQEKVDDINRLVVIYVTRASDGSINILPELAETMKELSSQARDRISQNIEGAHPVFFIKIDADECPELCQTLEADQVYPAFVFTQTGAEIVDLRMEDIPTKDICTSLRAAVASFHETSIDEEEYEDEDEDFDEDGELEELAEEEE